MLLACLGRQASCLLIGLLGRLEACWPRQARMPDFRLVAPRRAPCLLVDAPVRQQTPGIFRIATLARGRLEREGERNSVWTGNKCALWQRTQLHYLFRFHRT